MGIRIIGLQIIDVLGSVFLGGDQGVRPGVGVRVPQVLLLPQQGARPRALPYAQTRQPLRGHRLL